MVEQLSEKNHLCQGRFSSPRSSQRIESGRKLLALIIVGVLLVLYLGAIGCFLMTGMETNRLIAAVAALSGLQALAAAAVGYYYGAQSADNK